MAALALKKIIIYFQQNGANNIALHSHHMPCLSDGILQLRHGLFVHIRCRLGNHPVLHGHCQI